MALNRRRASDQIVDELRRRIVAQVWKDGEQLPTEKALSQEFDVSPNTVREAIRALGALGLVEVRRGSGAYVRIEDKSIMSESLGTLMRLNSVPLADAMGLSRYLHLRAAELAVDRATEADLQRLERASHASVDENSANNALQVLEFLRALVKCADEPLVASLTNPLDELIVIHIFQAFADSEDTLRTYLISIREKWQDVSRGVSSRDVEQAKDAVSGYYDATAKIVNSLHELRDTLLVTPEWNRLLEDLAINRKSVSESDTVSAM